MFMAMLQIFIWFFVVSSRTGSHHGHNQFQSLFRSVFSAANISTMSRIPTVSSERGPFRRLHAPVATNPSTGSVSSPLFMRRDAARHLAAEATQQRWGFCFPAVPNQAYLLPLLTSQLPRQIWRISPAYWC